MSSAHLVDPQLKPLLDQFPAMDYTAESLPVIRAGMAEMLPTLKPPARPDVEERELRVPGPAGAPDVRILVFRPKNAKTPTAGYLDIHGGGYLIGAAEMSSWMVHSEIAADFGVTVVSVDYRLAPENPHPAPVEDCYAALKWFHAHAAELGVDPNRIAIGGESAGGGLAASLALLARDRGEVPLIHQHLIYPMIDDRTVTLSDPHPYTGEFVWGHEKNRFGWTSLLGQTPGSPNVSPYAAAARADRLEGLPPTFIAVGALDLFLEEDLEYARRLTRAGVPVEFHLYPGAYHGFTMAREGRIASAFARDSREALRQALNG